MKLINPAKKKQLLSPLKNVPGSKNFMSSKQMTAKALEVSKYASNEGHVKVLCKKSYRQTVPQEKINQTNPRTQEVI